MHGDTNQPCPTKPLATECLQDISDTVQLEPGDIPVARHRSTAAVMYVGRPWLL